MVRDPLAAKVLAMSIVLLLGVSAIMTLANDDLIQWLVAVPACFVLFKALTPRR
jgi:hypothetical protein